MIKSALFSCLYPNRCASCGEIIENDALLCDYCAVKVDNVNFDNQCIRCGYEKEFCVCKFREFHFLGISGAYKNAGIARKVYYSYKLGKQRELAPFFAHKVSAAVRQTFKDIKFDALCCVPTAYRSRLKRGFDHNGIIGRMIAVDLKIKYLDGVLKARHFVPMQHKSRFPKRLANVRGKYYTVGRINANRILLFDDIYTTGATLDECAKELMFAGAREVYCASVLLTYRNNKTNGVKNNGN